MENLYGNKRHDEDEISRFSVDENLDALYPRTDDNGFYGAFAYEDYEKMTGKSYQSYLRIHDDMI